MVSHMGTKHGIERLFASHVLHRLGRVYVHSVFPDELSSVFPGECLGAADCVAVGKSGLMMTTPCSRG